MRSIHALLLSVTAFSAQAVVIDFDTLPGGGSVADGAEITNQYASLGVTFSVIENGLTQSGGPLATTTFAPTGQEGNRLGNFYGGSYSNRGDILRIDFSELAYDVSFDFFPQGSDGDLTRVLALDESLTTISDNLTGISGFPLIENYTVVGSGIARLDIFQPTDGWNWGLDNLAFSFERSSVPEPGTLAVLGLGVAGLAWTRKRKLS